MNKGDQVVERGARLLRELSQKARAQGGVVAARVAPLLAEDSAFLRKLKPSLVAARIRGKAPTDGRTASGGTTVQKTPKPRRRRTDGPSPFVVIGVALLAGVFTAKLIDWRGHAHPRD